MVAVGPRHIPHSGKVKCLGVVVKLNRNEKVASILPDAACLFKVTLLSRPQLGKFTCFLSHLSLLIRFQSPPSMYFL